MGNLKFKREHQRREGRAAGTLHRQQPLNEQLSSLQLLKRFFSLDLLPLVEPEELFSVKNESTIRLLKKKPAGHRGEATHAPSIL